MKIINLLKKVNKNFTDCYVVGGALRDILLEKNFYDIDIIIKNLNTKKLNKIICEINLPFVILDKENKIYRTVVKEENFTVDISSYTNLGKDLLRRDFTINTLLMSLEDFISQYERNISNYEKSGKKVFKLKSKFELDKVIDYFGAVRDIKNKKLRLVSEDSLSSDSLRILRVARFMSLGFVPDKKINTKVRESLRLLKKVSAERIADELRKIFSVSSYPVVEWMDKNNILTTIFPQLKIAKEKGKNTKFKKFYFHEEGLWQHIKLTYKKVEFVLDNLDSILAKEAKVIRQYFSDFPEAIFCVKVASLFHDIAKPLVIKRIDGRVRFFYHEEKSKEITSIALKKMKLSNWEINLICNLVENHMRLGNLCHSKDLTEKGIIRLFNKLGEDIFPLIILSLADRYSYDSVPERKKDLELNEMPVFKKFLRKLLRRYLEYKKRQSIPRLLNGDVLIKEFGLKEGPLIGEILDYVRQAQFLKHISTSDEAKKLVKEYLNNLKRSYQPQLNGKYRDADCK